MGQQARRCDGGFGARSVHPEVEPLGLDVSDELGVVPLDALVAHGLRQLVWVVDR
jgi:hypothetical protein